MKDANAMDAFLQEVAISSYFSRHKNCATIYGFYVSPSPTIVMKKYQMPLSAWIEQRLESKNLLTEILALSIDYILGIGALHTASFAHCDIKPQNVLLDVDQDNQYFAVLTDFGLTITMNKDLAVKAFKTVDLRGMSLQYAAPEVIHRLKNKSSKATDDEMMAGDIYAFGMSLYQMVTQHVPWPRMHYDQVVEAIEDGRQPNLEQVTARGPNWLKIAELMQRTWFHDYAARPKWTAIRDMLKAEIVKGK
eukprot:Partr_v1_DN28282_c0_g1_i1_m76466 putative protein kinase kinase kinase